MEEWIVILLPFSLILARVAGLVAAGPLMTWQAMPMRARMVIALSLAIFLATVMPVPAGLGRGVTSWLQAGILTTQEALIGAALGLAANLLFLAVRQGGLMISRQMGLADAGMINPGMGEAGLPLALIMEVTFVLYFFCMDGHHLLVMLLARSYDVLPIGAPPDLGALAGGIVQAGAAMLLMALQMAAPAMAAFLVLMVVMGILARILPELNILFLSLPIRIGLGFVLAALIVTRVGTFTDQVGWWINRIIPT